MRVTEGNNLVCYRLAKKKKKINTKVYFDTSAIRDFRPRKSLSLYTKICLQVTWATLSVIKRLEKA